jgi:glycosyltransferase involved in cell wall biosynthesis
VGVMRIAQLSYSSTVGGASRAVRKLHDALISSGHDGRLIVADRSGNDYTESPVSTLGAAFDTALAYADGGLSLLQRPADRALRGVATFPTPLERRLRREHPDVVNMHWVGLGTVSVAQIGRILRDYPTVWSLHDMWAMSGAEFYGEDSSTTRRHLGYTAHNRPPGDRGVDMDRWVWQRKARHFNTPAHIVTASRWIASLVADAALTRDWPVSVIPYSIDLDLFSPADNTAAKKAIGLTPDDPVVLFGANKGPADPRKGWDLLVEALTRLWLEGQRFHLVVFGSPDPGQAPRFPFPIIWLGNITSDQALADTYRLADLIAIPSRADNLPLTGLESQACGIPVVAFDTAGMPDVAVHRDTGYLAHPFDPVDLAQGMGWILSDPGVRTSLSQSARARAEHLWRPETIATQYLEVYTTAMATHRR